MPNGIIGADTGELFEFAKRSRSLGYGIEGDADSTRPQVEGMNWTGSDRDRYVESWGATHDRIIGLSNGLDSLAEFLAMQAAHQDICSDADGRVDLSAYNGYIGGSDVLIDIGNWFDNTFNDSTVNNGQSYQEAHPDWQPDSIGVDAESLQEEIMDQGSQGDCWFLAGLMSVAQQHPELLADRIKAKGDPLGSEGWDVELYVDGEWHTQHVDPGSIGVDGAMQYKDEKELPGAFSVFEQAYMQQVEFKESLVRADNPDTGLSILLGPDVEFETYDMLAPASASEVREALDDNRSVTVCTDLLQPLNDDLVGAHCYQVVAADPDAGTVTLRNPWGPDGGKPYEVTVSADSIDLYEMAIEQPSSTTVLAPGPLDGSSAPSTTGTPL